jgi:hypothetical protein
MSGAAPADDAEDVLSMPWPTASGPIERYPLAALGGARPPRPDWFEDVLAHAPERTRFTHDGVELELLVWGEVGRPGLLFLHGDAAHAGWWEFVAPYFAKDYRCAALSFGGMGLSGHRDAYSFEIFAAEAIAALPAAGLDKGPVRPIVVAHSLGSYPAMVVAAECPDIAG